MPINYKIYLGIIVAIGILLLATNIIWYSWNTREISECNVLMAAREAVYNWTCPTMKPAATFMFNITEVK
jgi:hypothetical protein